MNPDDFRTFGTESLLGAILVNQRRFSEAESLLLSGYKGIKAREATLKAHERIRLIEALERLVQFYETQGKQVDATKWRKELESTTKENRSNNKAE